MELTEWSWQGYGRKHGAPGIRNRVLVIYTVKCSEFVARRIVEESGHPDVELVGFDGCTDNQYAVDLLISLIKHPNVGAVLTVGLGCEYIQPQWLADVAVKECKEASWMFIQQEGGTKPAVTKGTAWVGEALERLKHTPRVRMGFKDLVIGAEWWTWAAAPYLRRLLRPSDWTGFWWAGRQTRRLQGNCAIPTTRPWITANPCASIRSAPGTLPEACPP